MKLPISPDINGRVNAANLSASDLRIEEEFEIRMAHLSEIATDTLLAFQPQENEDATPDRSPFETALGGDLSAVAEYFFSSHSEGRDHGKSALSEHLSAFYACDSLTLECDKAYFSAKLVEAFGQFRDKSLDATSFFAPVEKKRAIRVHFVGNGEMESACYRLVPDENSTYIRTEGVEDSCRDALEEGEYAIVPRRSSRDGTIHLCLNLISRYDLCVRAVCRVERSDSFDGFTDFVLVSQTGGEIARFLPDERSGEPIRLLLKLRGNDAEYSRLADITTAAKLLGASLESFDLIERGTKEGFAEFLLPIDRLDGLLAYIVLFCGGSDAVAGIFQEV